MKKVWGINHGTNEIENNYLFYFQTVMHLTGGTVADHRLFTKMDTVMMRVQPQGHQLEVEVEVESVQTEPGLVIVEIIEDSLTAMVKNLVELLINLVSSKIELLCKVSHYAVYLTFSNENTILSPIK